MLKFLKLNLQKLICILLSVCVAIQVRFYQCSSNLSCILASKDKDFAFAFLPLTTADGPVVSDSEHVLPLYSLPKSNEEPTFYLKQDQSKLYIYVVLISFKLQIL
jgi:hypothetical protein